MSRQQSRFRIVLCGAGLALLAMWLLYCCTPYAVCRFGFDLRPPWEGEAEWHFSRIAWFVQDAGYEHIVHRHRADLIAMGVEAVPTLIECVATRDKSERERAIWFLKEIGQDTRPLVLAAATAAEGDRRGRLLYALFVAFEDRDAFDQWLDYAWEHGPIAFEETHAEYHIQSFWSPSMPDYVVESGGGYAINPEFVEWWRAHGATVPFSIRLP